MKSKLLPLYSGHVGTIFSNMSIFGLIVSIALLAIPMLWVLLGVLYLLILVTVTLLSLGTIWLSESARTVLLKLGELLAVDQAYETLGNALKYFPIVAGVTAGIIAVSMIALFIDRKNNSSKTRLIMGCVFLVLLAIAFIVHYILRMI